MNEVSASAMLGGNFATTVFLLGPFLLSIYAAAIIIYNLYFHPLKNYPGPKLWAASRIPWCWNQYRGVNYRKLLDLHIKYGHVVRIGPNEISYTKDEAWKTVYGHRSVEMGKDPVFSLHTPTGIQNILVADRPTHTRQRRLLSHAFSEKALREQEGILQGYTNQLIRGLNNRRSEAVDIGAWFMFTTFDLISDLSFGDNVGCLAKGEYDPYVSATPAISKELQYYQMLKYWKIDWMRQYLMPKAVAGARMNNMRRAMAIVGNRIERNDKVDRKDFLHYILAANDEKGMSRKEIDVNAFSISTAGSESTATVLTGAIWFLLRNPTAYDLLTTEIRSAFTSVDEISLLSIKKLEYLKAVLQETMRLYPPVAITMPRHVPPEEDGVVIVGEPVPAGTTVGVNYYAAFHSPHNFHDPEQFAPERWLPASPGFAPYAHDSREVCQPFSYGPRNCLGKNLAWAEMLLVLARVLWEFDIEWPKDEAGRAQFDPRWQTGQLLFGFWVKPPLMVKLQAVVREGKKPFGVQLE